MQRTVTYATSMYWYLSKISSGAQIFNLGNPSSGHTIVTWMRMWECAVIFWNQKEPASPPKKSLGKSELGQIACNVIAFYIPAALSTKKRYALVNISYDGSSSPVSQQQNHCTHSRKNARANPFKGNTGTNARQHHAFINFPPPPPLPSYKALQPNIRFWLAQPLSSKYLYYVLLFSNCVCLCSLYLPKRHLPNVF